MISPTDSRLIPDSRVTVPKTLAPPKTLKRPYLQPLHFSPYYHSRHKPNPLSIPLHLRCWFCDSQSRGTRMSRGTASGPKGKKKSATFTIDCSKPVEDKIMDVASLEKFLQERIKVGGKAGALGDSVTVTREKSKITVTSDSNLSKRYPFSILVVMLWSYSFRW